KPLSLPPASRTMARRVPGRRPLPPPAFARAGRRLARVHPGRDVTPRPPLRDGRARGHGKSELGAAARGACHGDLAVHGLDEALDDVQAEAGAATALAAPELAEHAERHLGRYPLALVAHGHGDRFLLITA